MKKLSDDEKWSLLTQTASASGSDKRSPEETADLGVAYMAEVVAQLSSDSASDLLRSLPQDFGQKVLGALLPDKAAGIREILSYPPGTAGAMMAKEFLHIPAGMTLADAIEFMHLIPKERKGKVPYIYVVDRDKRLAGVFETKDLVFNPLDTSVDEIMNDSIVSVPPTASQSELSKLFEDSRYLAVPVVGPDKRVIGVVSADNMLQAVKAQAEKDIAKIVGTDAEEMKTHSIPKIMRLRLPWLLVNIVSGLLCAFISGLFEQNVEAITVLFLFVPVVLGISESTGIQGATIVVRNLTLGNFKPKDLGGLFLCEIIVGMLIGIVCAVIVGIVTSLWQGNPALGAAVGISMNVAIVISALIGLLLPLVFKAIRVDPAIASGPLVLAICDLQTLCVYFSLAGQILKHGPAF